MWLVGPADWAEQAQKKSLTTEARRHGENKIHKTRRTMPFFNLDGRTDD